MCLAQGQQRSDAGEARTRGPSVSSQALYHWATALPQHNWKIDLDVKNQIKQKLPSGSTPFPMQPQNAPYHMKSHSFGLSLPLLSYFFQQYIANIMSQTANIFQTLH